MNLTAEIQHAAQRVANAEHAQAAANELTGKAEKRLADLVEHQRNAQTESSSIRANAPTANDLTDEQAARLYALGLDLEDLAELVQAAQSELNKAAAQALSASAALDTARREQCQVEARARIEAIEVEARKAEKCLMAAISEIARSKREAGIMIRSGSDIFRMSTEMAKFANTGFVPEIIG